MAKILIRKQKKEYIPELKKEVITIQALKYYVTDLSKDFHTKYGIISKKDLNSEDGTIIKSNTGKEFIIFTAQFSDKFKKLKRAPQTIIQKDIGAIIAETGLGKKDEVLDAGTGAGALACALANICHKVYSYETRKEHLEVARQNIKTLNITNVILRNRDITKEVQEKNINLATLDIPEPWKATNSVKKALKIGAYLLAYTPTILQASNFAEEIKKHDEFLFEKTIEIIQRKWIVDGKRLRPDSAEIGHTAFLTFVRKIK